MARGGKPTAILDEHPYTMRDKLVMLAWVTPFVTILAGVMIVLYTGLATPSETAGVGAILALIVIGIMYGVWRPSRLMPILTGTMRESSMLLLIVGFSLLYAYVMSYLHISQSAAVWLTSLGLSKWGLLDGDPVVYRGAWLFPSAGVDHLDDGAGHSAAGQGRGLRSDLVRRHHHHRDGDGPHPSSRRPQSLRDQEHRTGYPAVRSDVGNAALCRLMAVAIVLICLVSGHRDAAAQRDQIGTTET